MSEIETNKKKFNELYSHFLELNEASPKYIYQYCSTETFRKIIENKELWLTDPSFMNDYLEMHYLDKYINEALLKINCDMGAKQTFYNFFQTYACKANSFFSCFSSSGDILSQWRSYADDGCGFSIKFDVSHWNISSGVPNQCESIPKPSSLLRMNRIHYFDEKKDKDILTKLIEITLRFIENKNFNAQLCGSGGTSLLVSLQNIVKNPAFSEEKEVRIIYRDPSEFVGLPDFGFKSSDKDGEKNFIINNFLKEKKYRNSKNSISIYYPLTFDSEHFIKAVILGPKNKSKDRDIESYLKHNRFNNVEVLRSAASYQ